MEALDSRVRGEFLISGHLGLKNALKSDEKNLFFKSEDKNY